MPFCNIGSTKAFTDLRGILMVDNPLLNIVNMEMMEKKQSHYESLKYQISDIKRIFTRIFTPQVCLGSLITIQGGIQFARP